MADSSDEQPLKFKRHTHTERGELITIENSLWKSSISPMLRGLQKQQDKTMEIMRVILSQNRTVVFKSFIEKELDVTVLRNEVENSLKGVEAEVRILVAELVEGIEAQKRCLNSLGQRIEKERGFLGSRDGDLGGNPSVELSKVRKVRAQSL
jgi:Mg2+ and Co2+ transporter CorA